MTAPYVPQVGDRITSPAWEADGEWADITQIVMHALDQDGEEITLNWSPAWVKVDKPEPWPEYFHVISRTDGWLGVSGRVAPAIERCRKGPNPADLRIWRSNPDGSVTVLDHEGKELP